MGGDRDDDDLSSVGVKNKIVFEGRLFKRGKKLNGWHGRQVALKMSGELLSQKLGRQETKTLLFISKNSHVSRAQETNTGYRFDVTSNGETLELKARSKDEATSWAEAINNVKEELSEREKRNKTSPRRTVVKKEIPVQIGVRLSKRPANIAPLTTTTEGKSGWYKNAYLKQIRYSVDENGGWTALEVSNLAILPNVLRACMGTIQGCDGWYHLPSGNGERVYYEISATGEWKRATPPALEAQGDLGTVQGEEGWYMGPGNESTYCRRNEKGEWDRVRAKPAWSF